MLTNDEQKFITWWQQNRDREKTLPRRLRLAVRIALIFGVAVLLNFATGWYTRANMVANTGSTIQVIIIGILIVAVFTSIFYSQHKWEMNEQRYLELLYKQRKEKAAEDMQQTTIVNSQEENKN